MHEMLLNNVKINVLICAINVAQYFKLSFSFSPSTIPKVLFYIAKIK